MRNAFTTGQLQTIRTRPQSADWHLAIHKPRVVGDFIITNLSNYAGSVIGELGVLGSSSSSAIAGQTGVVYDTNGCRMGDVRIRKTWRGSGTLISIAEAGSGLIDWYSSSMLRVLDQYRPWIKHPRYNSSTSQWMMDFDIEYDGQLNTWGAYANAGTPIVATPASSGKWVIDFVGENSFSLQASILSQTWDFPDGQQVTSSLGTTASPVKMTFTGASPGGSYFSLTVEDSFGVSQISRRLIFALDNLSQLPKVQVSDLTGGIEAGGYQARFLVTGSPSSELSEENYPHLDNSEVIVYERANYGNTQSSFGGNVGHRGSTVFRGWIRDKEIRVSPFSSDMMLSAETINGIINQGDSYDIFLANYQSGGSDWTEIGSLTLDSVTQFALKWRSTLAEITDWTPMGGLGSSPVMLYQSLPRSGFFDQLKSNYYDRGVLGYFSSDMQSGLHSFFDMQLSGSNTNGSVSLISSDKRDMVGISTPARDANAQVKLYAVTSDIPYGAESPGHVRGYFGGERVYERGLLTDTQQRLIDWSGNYRAKLNNKFPRTSVPIANNMRIDPVPQSVVELSLAASENARGISWSNQAFLTKELNVTYEATTGYPLYDISLEKYTVGIGGSSITFPAIDDLVPLPTNPPPPGAVPIPTTPPVTGTFGDGQGTVYVQEYNALWRTRNFSATLPTWVDIGSSLSENWVDFILDPYTPDTTGYAISDSQKLYKSIDLDTVSPTWTMVADLTAYVPSGDYGIKGNQSLVASINYEGMVVVTLGYWGNSSGGWSSSTGYVGLVVTTDRFESDIRFVSTALTFKNTFNRGRHVGAISMVPHVVGGKIVVYVGNSQQLARVESSDGFVTHTESKMTISAADDDSFGAQVHCPYDANEDGNKVYYSTVGTAYNNTDGQRTWRIDNVVGTLVGASAAALPDVPVPPSSLSILEISQRRYGFETSSLNFNLQYFWTRDNDLYVSVDGGATYELRSNLPNVIGSGGYPYNENQFYALTNTSFDIGKIYISTDGGYTFVEKSDPLITTIINAGNSQWRCGIHPLWTE